MTNLIIKLWLWHGLLVEMSKLSSQIGLCWNEIKSSVTVLVLYRVVIWTLVQ